MQHAFQFNGRFALGAHGNDEGRHLRRRGITIENLCDCSLCLSRAEINPIEDLGKQCRPSNKFLALCHALSIYAVRRR